MGAPISGLASGSRMTVALRTAFELPFEVTHPGRPFLSTGASVDLILELKAGVARESVIDTLTSTVSLFAALAGHGGLCGSRIHPGQSHLNLRTEVELAPGLVVFNLTECLVDDCALVVLCDLLLHRRHSGSLRRVACVDSGRETRLQEDSTSYSTYPDVYGALPFDLADEMPESGAYTFIAELAQPLNDVNASRLDAALKTWSRCVLSGGFALAPIPPEENYVEPDDPFVTFDNTVEWTFFKHRAHPRSLSALVNVFAAFHYRCQAVQLLTIR